jgi:hypothetical protein
VDCIFKPLRVFALSTLGVGHCGCTLHRQRGLFLLEDFRKRFNRFIELPQSTVTLAELHLGR